MPVLPGSRMGPYEILLSLGAGGMGEVYKARDTRLDRIVAIKILPPDKTGDAARKQRFFQEAKAASALNHPNIVTVYDIGPKTASITSSWSLSMAKPWTNSSRVAVCASPRSSITACKPRTHSLKPTLPELFTVI